jgi:hypothetical protein
MLAVLEAGRVVKAFLNASGQFFPTVPNDTSLLEGAPGLGMRVTRGL